MVQPNHAIAHGKGGYRRSCAQLARGILSVDRRPGVPHPIPTPSRPAESFGAATGTWHVTIAVRRITHVMAEAIACCKRVMRRAIHELRQVN